MNEKVGEFFVISTEHGDFKTKYLTKTHTMRKKWEPVNPLHVISHIPGNVIEYKVSVGDTVKVGDPLLLFKAMKMDSIVLSTVNAKVKKLCAEIDKSVPKGELLLEFE
ncbi:MAG: biotin/lipoyl-containing protein [Rikenellaceae bacterium]